MREAIISIGFTNSPLPDVPNFTRLSESVPLAQVYLVEALTFEEFARRKNFTSDGEVFVASLQADFQPSLSWIEAFQKINPSHFSILDFASAQDDVLKEVYSLLEKQQRKEQLLSLAELASQQQEELKQLYSELERRVERRQKALLESRQKSFSASLRWAAAQQASVLVTQASSLAEIESALLKALRKPLHIQTCKIRLGPDFETQKQLLERAGIRSLSIKLLDANSSKSLGEWILGRDSEHQFDKEEVDFLDRLSEVVSLSVQRLLRHQELASIQEEWQATFNAIGDPLALLHANYQVQQANKNFQKSPGSSHSTICYERLFQRSQPCPGCQMGKDFRLEVEGRIIEVSSQSLRKRISSPSEGEIFFHHYRDVTEARKKQNEIRRLERQAEIGSLSASMAHELNNPLAGILSFVQLLKMEPDLPENLREDLAEMEVAVRRCQTIVQNLLTESRDL